jgi:hypothetical protein
MEVRAMAMLLRFNARAIQAVVVRPTLAGCKIANLRNDKGLRPRFRSARWSGRGEKKKKTRSLCAESGLLFRNMYYIGNVVIIV